MFVECKWPADQRETKHTPVRSSCSLSSSLRQFPFVVRKINNSQSEHTPVHLFTYRSVELLWSAVCRTLTHTCKSNPVARFFSSPKLVAKSKSSCNTAVMCSIMGCTTSPPGLRELPTPCLYRRSCLTVKISSLSRLPRLSPRARLGWLWSSSTKRPDVRARPNIERSRDTLRLRLCI